MEHLWKQNLRQIEPYVPGEQSSDPDRIKLNANENPYPPAPGVEAVLRSYDPAALCLVPGRQRPAAQGVHCPPLRRGAEQVFVGNGSDDVLALAFQSFFNSDKPHCLSGYYLQLLPGVVPAVSHSFCDSPADGGFSHGSGGLRGA